MLIFIMFIEDYDSYSFDDVVSFLLSCPNINFQAVVEILRNHSGPGGLHENTFLVVMGDHGQTTNGDHGGGTAEEVCT